MTGVQSVLFRSKFFKKFVKLPILGFPIECLILLVIWLNFNIYKQKFYRHQKNEMLSKIKCKNDDFGFFNSLISPFFR